MPEGERLRLLVRVPLEAMRDFVFPERGPGYLDIAAADSMLRDAIMVWVGDELELYEDGNRLTDQQLRAVRVSLPSSRAFASYDEALSHVTGPPLSPDMEIGWEQAMLDALFEYRIRSDQAEFSINPTLGRLGIRTITVLRFVLPNGTVRAFEYSGNPGLVRLDPRWHQAALRFVALGFEHILDGVDHLLFLACLVIPFRRLGPLVAIVTSFHGGALCHADCLGLRACPTCLVVSTSRGDLDRVVDRLHGVRKYRGREAPAPVAHHVCVWARPRVRVLVRPARDTPVRGVPPAHVVAPRSTLVSSLASCSRWSYLCRC